MNRIRGLFRGEQEQQQYERVHDDDTGTLGSLPDPKPPVSLYDYGVFLLLGCAMLWSWNMFMACTTYFQSRFADSEFIKGIFQSSFLTISCITNLISVSYLSSAAGQKNANYPFRISSSLLSNTGIFTVLAFSTILSSTSSAGLYFSFVCFIVFLTSIATSLAQNGVLAFVNDFQPIYIQAVMTGQGLAGVLPAIAQIVSVLIIPPSRDENGHVLLQASPKSAFVYFLTAIAISSFTYLAFRSLLKRHGQSPVFTARDSEQDSRQTTKNTVPLAVLLSKLRYYAFSVGITFAVTMVFPVFTQFVVSNRTGKVDHLPRLLEPDIFIPFAFLIWNLGDFSGRAVCASPKFQIRSPSILVLAALARTLFIPLYYTMNIKNRGGLFDSDLVYWLVQFSFGFTNGWVGSNSIMSAPQAVEEELREASGGFMGMCLVFGLTVGSILSFSIAL